MFKRIGVDWNALSEKHRIVGLVGIGLLFLYLVLTAVWPGFRSVFFRGLYMLVCFMKNWLIALALIPIYLNWISTDYFQERRRTSYGNAATNGFMGLWVSIEWFRTSYFLYQESPNLALFLGKLVFMILILAYALIVIVESIRGRKVAHIIGRVRDISFLAILITPIIYEMVPIDFKTVLAIILLVPMLYGVAEFVEYTVLPAPVAEKKRSE